MKQFKESEVDPATQSSVVCLNKKVFSFLGLTRTMGVMKLLKKLVQIDRCQRLIVKACLNKVQRSRHRIAKAEE